MKKLFTWVHKFYKKFDTIEFFGYRFDKRFIKFLLVGGLNTLFGYGMFVFFRALGLHFVLATLCAHICGVLFNFKTTGALVFKSRDNRLIVRFFLVYLVVYFFNIGGIWLFREAGCNDYLAGFLVLIPQAVFSFLLMRRFVFAFGKDTQAESP